MTSFAISLATQVCLPIVGSDKRFPVRRIYCVGRNYADHVVEMGGDLSKSKPVIFTKDASTIVESGSTLPYPANTDNLHHEIELVVAMGEAGIFGYGVGLDMTRRDLQANAKERRGPWDRAKNFVNSAPCAALTKADQMDITKASIELSVNGETRQSSTIDKMIWSIDTIIEFIREDMDLQAVDLIFTGTPEGVGSISKDDKLVGSISGLEDLKVSYI